MDVHPSGYYAWKKQPISDKVRDDQRLLGLLKQAWLESGCVYGYRNITKDMRDGGFSCSENRVYRLMREAQIASARGYKRHPGFKGAQNVLPPAAAPEPAIQDGEATATAPEPRYPQLQLAEAVREELLAKPIAPLLAQDLDLGRRERIFQARER